MINKKLQFGKALRTLQTTSPQLLELKYKSQFFYRQILKRPFESDFKLLNYFNPSDNAPYIDIGANRGQSVQAIRMFTSNSPIYSFEPSSHTYKQLCHYTKNVRNIERVRGGLGDSESSIKLFTPVYKGFVFDGLASTRRSVAADWLVDRIFFFDQSQLEIREESIEIRPLDHYNLEPALIKIDVQGAEMEVLRGARQTIARSFPLILIETPRPEYETAFLSDLGYSQYSWRDGKLFPGNSTVNIWFVHPERLAQLHTGLVS